MHEVSLQSAYLNVYLSPALFRQLLMIEWSAEMLYILVQ